MWRDRRRERTRSGGEEESKGQGKERPHESGSFGLLRVAGVFY